MKVDLAKEFPLAAPAAEGWALLRDIPAVAGCMPGAAIDEKIDATHYKGRVKARIGPATMAFRGDISVPEIEPETHRLRLIGKGMDSKGSSSAEMDLNAHIEPRGEGRCVLIGSARVTVNGKAATLGGRMMTQVADQILDQFGNNFAQRVAARGDSETAAATQQSLENSPGEINGLRFAWRVVKGYVRGLFRKKS